METKMLLWTSGETDHGNTQNEEIRDRFRIAGIVKKIRESLEALVWTCDSHWRELTCKIGLNMKNDTKQPKGRLKQWWLYTLDDDLWTSRLHLDQAYDWAKWRIKVEPSPLLNGTKDKEEQRKCVAARNYGENILCPFGYEHLHRKKKKIILTIVFQY